MLKSSLALAALLLLPIAVAGQSPLAELAKKAAAERAATKAADKKGTPTPAPASKVYTNKDLPARRATPTVDAPTVDVPSAPLPDAVAPELEPATGPTASQQRDVALGQASQALLNAERQLQAGVVAQQNLQRSYDQTCDRRSTLPYQQYLDTIQPCARMRAQLRYDVPQMLDGMRANVHKLEQLVTDISTRGSPLASVSPSAACPAPPYTWDPNPKVLRCRGPNGRFAASACCGH